MKIINRLIFLIGAFFSVTVPMILLMFKSTAVMIKKVFSQNKVF